MEAVAVLETISVVMADRKVTIKTITGGWSTSRTFSCFPIIVESPDRFEALANANPPPISRTVPHDTLSCTTVHVRQPSLGFVCANKTKKKISS